VPSQRTIQARCMALMRVRGFTQDDAHIFLYRSANSGRSWRFIDMLQEVYKDFGFNEVLG